ncbi:hypothetical protein [Vibrio fluvialis]|uniref:hypothetical protein n=1 Tax=Vibrio fluvialis TaxID=676 RepID=UPI0037DBDBFC
MNNDSKEKQGALKRSLSFARDTFRELTKFVALFCIFVIIGAGFGFGLYKSVSVTNLLSEKMIVIAVVDNSDTKASNDAVKTDDDKGGQKPDDFGEGVPAKGSL